jgi:Druantia protein DruA
VWDECNGKVMGLIALGDPSFNLAARDHFIGWNSRDREERLVNLMDAYVLGAVPPYSYLLGGKLIACLVRSREVVDVFHKRYYRNEGLISGTSKRAHLVAVTTSSALGRSSVYNRLRLKDVNYFTPIGFTGGWGHFHVSDQLFDDMRKYLSLRHHPYAHGYEYGDGPNWRMRTIRAALHLLGFDSDLLRHGINREVFISLLADNATQILRGERRRPSYATLRSVSEISDFAIERWLVPRAFRRPEFMAWDHRELLPLLDWRQARRSVASDEAASHA